MTSMFRKASGFTLISALFLVVVVALLGGYMVELSTAQHTSSAGDIAQTRARYALKSGVEWVAYQLFESGRNCSGVRSSTTPVTVSDLGTGSDTGSLEGFEVKVTQCDTYFVSEGSLSYALFDVSLSAEQGTQGSPDYVKVEMSATLSEN